MKSVMYVLLSVKLVTVQNPPDLGLCVDFLQRVVTGSFWEVLKFTVQFVAK